MDGKTLVMTGQQVRDFDRYAIEKLAIPGIVLMENAGSNCAHCIIEHLNGRNGKIGVICGTGNNGGDGFVIARHLANKGLETEIIIAGNYDKIKGDAKTNLTIVEKMGLNITIETNIAIISTKIQKYDLTIDAIFGTGLQGPLRPEYISIINAVNDNSSEIIAVDIPSGLNCNSGKTEPTAIKAAKTITFVAMKKGFTSTDAAKYTGKIIVVDIGIDTGLTCLPEQGKFNL